MDVSSAFLQGNELQRNVIVRPPSDIKCHNKLWRLKRCLYGLSDAPREWYDRVSEELEGLGAKKSVYDKSVFMWHQNSVLIGIIAVHVDDFEYCGRLEWQGRIIGKLKETFNIKKNEKKDHLNTLV